MYRVIIIDDEIKHLKALRNRWEAVFSYAQMPVEIETSHEFELTERQSKDRPHFVIVDNVAELQVGGQTVREIEKGVDFIAQQKPSFTDSVFILSTAASFSIDVLGQKFPNPDLIVPKTALSNSRYQEHLGHILRRMINRQPFGNLNVVDPGVSNEINKIQPHLISIIEQCLHTMGGYRSSVAYSQANLTRIAGGYSGAQVFRLDVFDKETREKVPLVLEIAFGGRKISEASAYNDFVRFDVPHDMRVELLGCGESGELRGALYAFAFGGDNDYTSLSSCIREGLYDRFSSAVSSIFLSQRIRWYKLRSGVADAETYYANSEEYALSRDSVRIEQLRVVASSLLRAEAIECGLERIRMAEYQFAFIRKQLPRFSDLIVPVCVGHGDLNATNVLVSKHNGSISIIDFEYCGEANAYKDFVSFECSIRLESKSGSGDAGASFSDEVALELELFSGEISRQDYTESVKAIIGVRESCKTCFERQQPRFTFSDKLYAIALNFHIFKLIGIKSLDVESRQKLLASYVASGLFLEGSR